MSKLRLIQDQPERASVRFVARSQQPGASAHRLIGQPGASARRLMNDAAVVAVCCIWGLLAAGAYAAAEAKKPPASSQEASAVYGDAASYQNNGAFELAAEEWEKFLKRFPEDPLAPKARHYLGVCYLQLKRFDKAAGAFEAVVKNHPEFDLIQDAYVNLGWCQYTLGSQNAEGMHAKAAATFEELVKKFPEGKHTAQALYFLGESQYAQGKKQEAAAAYDRVVKDFPQSPLRADAAYALGVAHEETGDFAKAGQAYDLFLKDFPESDLATEVRMRKAETVLQAGDFAAAEQMFAVVTKVEKFAAADHALSRRAFCLSKLDKFAEAAALYATLATDHPKSASATEAILSAGRCFYRAGQSADAATWFQKVLDAGKGNVAEAAHWLCRIYLKNGEPQKAVELVKQVLPKAADDPYLVNLKMDEADALCLVDGSKAQAIDAYLKIVADQPQHELAAQALYNAAFTALELRQFDAGLTHAAAFLRAYPQDRLLPDVKYVAAECHLQKNEFAVAEKLYTELAAAHAEHPDREVWRVRLGLSSYMQKKYQDVVKLLEPVIGEIKKPENLAEAQFLIGASQFNLDQQGPAVAALQASLKAAPKGKQADEALLYLSRAQRKQNQLDDAIKTVEELIAAFPQSRLLGEAHYRYGEYSYAKGDFAKAATEYDAVLSGGEDSPFAPYAQYGKGWALLKGKDYAKATEAFTALIDGHPNHSQVPDAQFARGMCLRQEGKNEEATKDIDAYVKSEPELGAKCDALYERGLAEVGLKNFAAAARTFQDVLKANPQYPNADKVLYELSWALKSQNDPAKNDAAADAFSKLASSYPDSPLAAEANFHVGESQYDKGRYAEAAKAYVAAKEKAPAGELREKAIYKLGWSQYQAKDYEAALAEFTQQAESFPSGPLYADALFMKSECLFRQKNYADALKAYSAAQAVELSSPTIQVLVLLHGGQSASQLKEWDQAITLLSQIPEKHPESAYVPEALYELGWARQNSGKEDAAMQDYEKAATQSRGEAGARARFMLGELVFSRKDYAEATKQFQRVMFGYGGEQAPAEVKKWQAKSGYEAARCADVRIQAAKGRERTGLLAEAKKFYEYVIEKHPQDELAAVAKKRLDELAKL